MNPNLTNESSNLQNELCYRQKNFMQERTLSIKIIKVVCICIIPLISSVGNILIIVVVHKRKELRKTVNFFIANMAASDMIFPLINMPIVLASEVTGSLKWNVRGMAGLILCKLTFFLQHISLAVSAQSILWIGVDRFMAVVFPLKLKIISSRFRVTVIVSTWIVAITINLKYLYTMKLVNFDSSEGKECIEDFDMTLMLKVWSFVTIVTIWIAPLIVTTVLYCAIGVTLLGRHKGVQGVQINQKNKWNKQAIKMSISIVIVFHIFVFLPVAFLTLGMTGKWKSLFLNKTFCLFYDLISIFIYFGICLAPMTNPIICFTCVESYRRALKETFICRKSTNMKEKKKKKLENEKHEQISIKSIRAIKRNENNPRPQKLKQTSSPFRVSENGF